MCAVLTIPIVAIVAGRVGESRAAGAALGREQRGVVCALIAESLLAQVEHSRLDLLRAGEHSERALRAAGASIATAAGGLDGPACAGLVAGPRVSAVTFKSHMRAALAPASAEQVAWATLPLADDVLQLLLDVGDAAGLTYDPDVVAVNFEDALIARLPGHTERLEQAAEIIALDARRNSATRQPMLSREQVVPIEQDSGQARAMNAFADDDFDSAELVRPALHDALASARAATERTGSALATELDRDVALAHVENIDKRLRPLREASIQAGQRLMIVTQEQLSAALAVRAEALRRTVGTTLLAGAVTLAAGLILVAYVWQLMRRRHQRELDRSRERQRSLEIELARHNAERALLLTKQQFRAVFDSSIVGIAIIDADGAQVDANAALEAMFDHDLSTFTRTTIHLLSTLIAQNKDSCRIEQCFELARAGQLWVELSLSIIRSGGQHAGSAIVLAHDITELKTLNARLDHETLHDPLTGLPNRVNFLRRLRDVMRRDDVRFAVVFVDLDRFKVVNDTLGHQAGDDLLRLTAQRLSGAVRPIDVVARLHGDEFAVLLTDLEAQGACTEIDAVVARLHLALTIAVPTPAEPILVSASIGYVRDGANYRNPEELLADADRAMYRSKSEGRSRTTIFEPAMRGR